MCEFYRNITYNNGAYDIRHTGKHYGRYKKLTDALVERDLLKKCNWNIDEYVNSEPEYTYVEELLPPFNHTPSYIKVINGRYYVTRTVKGKTTYYKGFNLLKEALEHRDLLVNNNWDLEVEV